MPKIVIEVETEDFACDEKQVYDLCGKIVDIAEELKANPIEFACALGHLQGYVFKEYGVLAPVEGVVKFLQEGVEL